MKSQRNMQLTSASAILSTAMGAALVLFAGATTTGCRGWTSDSPPVHLNPNMDTQQKLKPYRASTFFKDGRAMRPQVEGTIARGQLENDSHRFEGKLASGKFAGTFPKGFAADASDVARGQERYNIYCTPCHAKAGAGNGPVARRLLIKPPTFHQDRIQTMPLGEIFDVISHGKNFPNMPSYGAQIKVEDRWRIALYVRALQRTRKPSLPITTSVEPVIPVFADADSDGIADADDKCPDEAEVINGVDDEDGCPDEGKSLVKMSEAKIEILDKVFFDSGKATIQKRSFNLLNQVALIMNANQKIKRIEVAGHTDATGDAKANKVLSKARANSVKAYLVSKGVYGGRLRAMGYGPDRPIADNGTKKGQDQNRRVEFVVLGDGGTAKAATAPEAKKPLEQVRRLPQGLSPDQLREHVKQLEAEKAKAGK